MKLGIVVVYLVSEENEKLLDLHLERIGMHTTVPYTIYGSANRLHPRLRQRLEGRPEIRLQGFPTTELRGGKEHRYYLERLVESAIGDGCTHVVTLHVDSFPIKTGWVEAMAATLSESCVLVTTQEVNTACLFFPRNFYLKFKPKFLVSDEEKAGHEFRAYFEQFHPTYHSGIGFAFKAHREGFSCHYLRTPVPHQFLDVSGRIYDDSLFHLRGAERSLSIPSGTLRFTRGQALHVCLKAVQAVIPAAWRRRLKLRFKWAADRLVDTRLMKTKREERRRLLEDPAAYLQSLADFRAV